jgi:hypothetical protein
LRSGALDASPFGSPTADLPATGSTLPDAPQYRSPERDLTLVTAFHSPENAASCEASIPGSMFPACYFTPPPAAFPARSTLLLHCPFRFAPVPAVSSLLARCSSFDWRRRLCFRLLLPFGANCPPQDQSFRWIRRRSARLPNPPDFHSLPTAHSIASRGCRSSFVVRYVSAAVTASSTEAVDAISALHRSLHLLPGFRSGSQFPRRSCSRSRP